MLHGDDTGATPLRDVDRAVRGAVVGDDDFIGTADRPCGGVDRLERCAEEAFLVVSGDDE